MVIFYESKHFKVVASEKPHVSRTDGGHIIILLKRRIENRWQLDKLRAVTLMKLSISMIIGEAMKKGLNKRGIPVERINFQDNGNWALGTKKPAHMHLHLYGRAKNSKHQKRGEALYFPDKKTQFWKKLEPLNEEDVKAILKEMKTIMKRKKYKSWR